MRIKFISEILLRFSGWKYGNTISKQSGRNKANEYGTAP